MAVPHKLMNAGGGASHAVLVILDLGRNAHFHSYLLGALVGRARAKAEDGSNLTAHLTISGFGI
jgi:hypothetical protein